MNRRALFFGLSSVVALAGLVGACYSSAPTIANDGTEGGTSLSDGGDGKETGGDGKETGGGSKDSSTPIVTDSSVTPPTGDEACAAEKTNPACGSCCMKNHAAGAKAIQDSVEACACKGMGADGGTPVCMTECASTFCATPPVQPIAVACSTCLQASISSVGACQASASAACTASADCVAEQKCVMPCLTKP